MTDNGTPNDPVFDLGIGKHVLYFGDPLCSWCWGFAPVLNRITKALEGRAPLHMIMGGLRPGTRAPWDQDMRAYIRHHWQDVQATTGQPFAYARFDDESFVYDTEPPCRALVTVQALKPEAAPVFFEAVQRAFYAEGQDVTQPDTLTAIAAACGVDAKAFARRFSQPHMRDLTAADFRRTQAFGVSSFPSLLSAQDGEVSILCRGYQSYSALQPAFEEWLNT